MRNLLRWLPPLALALLIITSLPASTANAQDAEEPPIYNLDTLRSCNFQSEVEVTGLRMGALLLNLETGRGCAENLNQTFPVASVPKLFVLGAYLEQVALGWRDFNERVTFTEDYYMGGNRDCLTGDDIGSTFTYEYLIDIMIACSDNSATWMLMDLMGWDTVQRYIDSLGIAGIGPVIPYAFVDRYKLAFLDPRWAEVPAGLASRYYRSRNSDGLVPTYFNQQPDYSREQRIDANAQYFYTYDYNTITPRAMTEYLLLMAERLNSNDFAEAISAWWFFETMMLTQRQFTTQDLPGQIYFGAKNGWDMGLKAEVSVGIRSFSTNQPEVLALVFVHQTDLYAPDVSLPNDETDLINQYLASISPQVEWILYPTEPVAEASAHSNILRVTFARESAIEDCRENTPGGSREIYLQNLELCWLSLPSLDRLPVGERLGTGIVLRGMENREARLTIIYTAPNEQQYAYQYNTSFVSEENVFWYHRLDQPGTWRVDIFQDLEFVYQDSIEAS